MKILSNPVVNPTFTPSAVISGGANLIGQTGGLIAPEIFTAAWVGPVQNVLNLTGSGVIVLAKSARCMNFEIWTDGKLYLYRDNGYADVAIDTFIGSSSSIPSSIPYVEYKKSLVVKAAAISASYFTRTIELTILRNS